MTEADAEDRCRRPEPSNHIRRDAGILGTSGPGRDQDLLGCHGLDLADRHLIIAPDAHVGAELEPDRRGIYAGAVGYLDFAGNLDFCITIRTLVITGTRAMVQAGAGIVADSNPAAEYEETRDKARAVLRALELAEAGLS